jgi:hypothetical protein
MLAPAGVVTSAASPSPTEKKWMTRWDGGPAESAVT